MDSRDDFGDGPVLSIRGRGEAVILGNSHTHRGRFKVRIISTGTEVSSSLPDVESASDAARRWIDGFLAGSEPSLYEYLGIDGAGLEPTNEDIVRWKNYCARFRASGLAHDLRRRPTKLLQLTREEESELHSDVAPWSLAGEIVWCQNRGRWIAIEPQPSIVADEFMVGTICASRLEHDLMNTTSDWTVCLDCSQVRQEP